MDDHRGTVASGTVMQQWAVDRVPPQESPRHQTARPRTPRWCAWAEPASAFWTRLTAHPGPRIVPLPHLERGPPGPPGSLRVDTGPRLTRRTPAATRVDQVTARRAPAADRPGTRMRAPFPGRSRGWGGVRDNRFPAGILEDGRTRRPGRRPGRRTRRRARGILRRWQVLRRPAAIHPRPRPGRLHHRDPGRQTVERG